MENHNFSWVNPLFQWPFSIGYNLQAATTPRPRAKGLDPNRLSARSRTRTLPGPGKKPWISVGPPIERIDFFMGILLMSINQPGFISFYIYCWLSIMVGICFSMFFVKPPFLLGLSRLAFFVSSPEFRPPKLVVTMKN